MTEQPSSISADLFMRIGEHGGRMKLTNSRDGSGNFNGAAGAPVGPVFWDGTKLADFDPTSMSGFFQWYEENLDLGTNPTLRMRFALRSAGTVVAYVCRSGRALHVLTDPTDTAGTSIATANKLLDAGSENADINSLHHGLSFAISGSTLYLNLNNTAISGEGEISVTLSATPDEILVMGNGVTATLSLRAMLLDLYDGVFDSTTRAAMATPQGAQIPSASDIASGAAIWTPPAVSFVA